MLVIISAVFVGFFSIGYKVLSINKYNSSIFLFLYSSFFSLASFTGVIIFRESVHSYYPVVYGLANGLSMFTAVYLYTLVVKNIRLNISWSILQFSLLIPILVSIFVYKEKAGFYLYTAVLFIIMAIYAFGKGKDKGGNSTSSAPKYSMGIFLLLSTIFTGIANTIPRIYVENVNTATTFPLLFYSGITISILSLLVILIKKENIFKKITPGLLKLSIYMGTMQAVAISLLVISLQSIPGVIVYPLRNGFSLLVIYLLSYIFFKEKMNKIEGAGAVFTIIAVILIGMAL